MGAANNYTANPANQLLQRFGFILLFASCNILLTILSPYSAHASPIGVPNLQQCQQTFDTSVLVGSKTTKPLNCCLPIPANYSVIDFSFSRYKSQNRVRQAAHKVSADYIAKYTRAYELMKALPANDPRSFETQARIHCAFCNGVYMQAGNASVPLQVHDSWLFLPWHRWYLYFHERILQSLLGDPSFSLVFWNWDDQQDGGNVMPAMFLANGSALYDANRNQANLPPTLVQLTLAGGTDNDSTIINQNLNAMYQGVVKANSAELFMGGAYRTGTDRNELNATLGGSIEYGIHSAIHIWTADPTQSLFQDMGTFTTAALDPIFYTHHSNVDRLWHKWHKGLPGGVRANHYDSDFLNAEFYFYDETTSLVKVKVRDALDNANLGVSYPTMVTDDLWVNYSPSVMTNGSALEIARASGVVEIAAALQYETISLGSQLTRIVKAPTREKADNKKAKVLVIQGLHVKRESFVALIVFVNLPGANASTATDSAEYVGTFNIIPSSSKDKNLTTNVKFEIGDNLQRLGIQNELEVVITLVVKGTEPIIIQGLFIHYQ